MSDEEPHKPLSRPPGLEPAVANGDIVALLTIFLAQLGEVEKRITGRLDEFAAGGRQYRSLHEQEHSRLQSQVDELDGRVHQLEYRNEREDLVFNARLGPVKKAGGLIVREWRVIVLAVLVAIDLLGRVIEQWARMFGL